MPPNTKAFPVLRRIAAKEATLFFASPVAYMFLGSFVAVTLFIVFWGEAFFARNIADVRPMFEWMPLLLIVLCSTLTMRMWSEERRTGTLDHVMTQPIPLWVFVLGKFVGCLSLLSIALLITLPLPLTVNLMGDLDWGPVLAGYLATFLLGAAYLAIGLYVSARSSNQIVSLLSAIALCGLFYLVGSPVITELVSDSTAEILRQLGAGSRFESITRGMVDLSDLAYYVSIVVGFLALNTFALEKERWSAASADTPRHQQWRLVTFLVLANALALNLWLGQTRAFRLDVTEGNQYSISEATQKYLGQLQEPLLIRGYFSSKTHPLLAPLVPKLKDLIEEYGVAAGSRVRIEFVDPASNPELEEEAGQDYGIKPVPFQVADRYQSAIVSSYFSVLVKYGSEFKVLGFQDLIEVKAGNAQDVQVSLRNPEYDLTRAIKKVVDTYQSDGNIFSKVEGKLTLNAYVSEDAKLPAKLQEFKKVLKTVADKSVADSGGKLTFTMVDPQADGGKVAEQLTRDYGLKPMVTDLFSPEQFYFYIILSKGEEQAVQIPIEDGVEATLERNMKAAVKRFASGFTKTVALVTPPSDQPYNPYSGGPPPGDFRELEAFLQNELTVVKEDLSDGTVSSQADILMLASPKNLDQKAVFAVDQFLMQGGTVVAMTSPYSASFEQGGLKMSEQTSGLQEWLEGQGLKVDKKLVMDPQNAALPIPVTRNLGGMQVQEIRMLDYPYFVDVREDGFASDSPILAELPQVTVAWPSPITVDKEKMKSRQVIELLRSSSGSWLSSSLNIMPLFDEQGNSGFVPMGAQSSQLLAVVASGRFDSAFTGKPNPLLSGAKENPESAPKAAGIIEHSPDSARIILLSSSDMLKDTVLKLQGGASGGAYLNTLQMMANAIDWSMEDASLLGIRARGNYNRTLPPMEQKTQMFWEGLNYLFAALALLLVAVARRVHDNRRLAAYEGMAAE
jgi:ABC-2 type transport system permease protein